MSGLKLNMGQFSLADLEIERFGFTFQRHLSSQTLAEDPNPKHSKTVFKCLANFGSTRVLVCFSIRWWDLSFGLMETAHQSCPKTVWIVWILVLPFQICQGAHIGVADHSNGHVLLVLAHNQRHSNQTEKVRSRTSRIFNTCSRTARRRGKMAKWHQIKMSLEKKCHEMKRQGGCNLLRHVLRHLARLETMLFPVSFSRLPNWRSRFSKEFFPKGLVMDAWNANVGNSFISSWTHRRVTQVGTRSTLFNNRTTCFCRRRSSPRTKKARKTNQRWKNLPALRLDQLSSWLLPATSEKSQCLLSFCCHICHIVFSADIYI